MIVVSSAMLVCVADEASAFAFVFRCLVCEDAFVRADEHDTEVLCWEVSLFVLSVVVHAALEAGFDRVAFVEAPCQVYFEAFGVVGFFVLADVAGFVHEVEDAADYLAVDVGGDFAFAALFGVVDLAEYVAKWVVVCHG